MTLMFVVDSDKEILHEIMSELKQLGNTEQLNAFTKVF